MTVAMTPHQHAEHAARMLAAQEGLERQLDDLSEDERLRLAVGGHVGRLNRDRQFTVEVASAHALTAIALTLPQLVRQLDLLTVEIKRSTHLR